MWKLAVNIYDLLIDAGKGLMHPVGSMITADVDRNTRLHNNRRKCLHHTFETVPLLNIVKSGISWVQCEPFILPKEYKNLPLFQHLGNIDII